MTSNYEAAEVLELGTAQDVLRGSKAPAQEAESVFGIGWRIEPLPDDIELIDE